MNMLVDDSTTLTIEKKDDAHEQIEALNQAHALRVFIKKMLDGHVEVNDPCPDIPIWKPLLVVLLETYQEELQRTNAKTKAVTATQRLIKSFRKTDLSFDFIMKLRSVKPQAEDITAYVPPLLSSKIPENKYDIGSARVWLEAYINWSMYWVPDAPYEWHEILGLWCVSTLIARRVIVHGVGNPVMTSFYTLLLGDSGLGKSSVANKAEELLNRIDNIGTKLIRKSSITAQALMKDASAEPAANYADLPPSHQKTEQERLLWAPYRALYWEEFLAKLQQIVSPTANTSMSGLKDILLNWINGYGAGNETMTNGHVKGGARYLSVVGCGVPGTLKNLAPGSAVWTDGTLGRFHLLYAKKIAPTEPRLDTSFVPDSLWMPLAMLHENLGIPTAEVLPVERSAEQVGRNVKQIYELVRKPNAETIINIAESPDVGKAYQKYKMDLERISLSSDFPEELKSNYQRMALRTLVFAVLIAISENGSQMAWCLAPCVEMRHWAAAQEIMERGRGSLHMCIDDLGVGEKTVGRRNEDRVTSVINRLKGQWVTFSQLKHRYLKTMDSEMLQKLLLALEAQQEIVTCKCPNQKHVHKMVTYYGAVGSPPPEDALEISTWAIELIDSEDE